MKPKRVFEDGGKSIYIDDAIVWVAYWHQKETHADFRMVERKRTT